MSENTGEINFQLEKGEGKGFKRLSLSREGVKYVKRRGDEISIIEKGISGERDKKVGILVGEHMVVRLADYPFAHEEPLLLSDGTEVQKGEKAAYIDFAFNLPPLKPDDNLIKYTRKLIKSGEDSLNLLAEMCQDDPRLKDVKVFFGISHLSRLAKRFGFDVFDVENEDIRKTATEISRSIADRVAGGNTDYEKTKMFGKDAQAAYISKGRLVEIFRSKNPVQEASKKPEGLTRRQMLKISGSAGAGLLLKSLGMETASADPGLENQKGLISEEIRESPEDIQSYKEKRERELKKEEEFRNDVYNLSKLLGEHWGRALRGPEGESSGDEYFLEEAEQCLLFAKKTRELLQQDENVKRRLYEIATFTDVGDKKPPYPPKDLKPWSPWWEFPDDHFVSPHFGPEEFDKLSHAKLTRLNLALCLAIGLTENGAIDTKLFDRLVVDKGSWNWDAFNAHIGRDALRYFTGITNSQIYAVGPESHGGIFSQDNTELPDRLVTMLQPLILTLRTFKPQLSNGKIENFEIVDRNGKPKYDLLRSYYPPSEVWIDRFSHVYAAFEQFCEQNQRYNWLLYQNILDKPVIRRDAKAGKQIPK